MPNTHESLTALFSDIADAIRTKTGEAAPLIADGFDTSIEGINLCNVTVDEVLGVTSGVASMQIRSRIDESELDTVSWEEPDCTSQNIVEGKSILGVSGTAKKCTKKTGTVTLAASTANIDIPELTSLPKALVLTADSFDAIRVFAEADEKPVYLVSVAPVPDTKISAPATAMNCVNTPSDTTADVRIAGLAGVRQNAVRVSAAGTSAKFEPGTYHWTAYEWED